MDFTQKELMEETRIFALTTLSTYLSRYEFRHIKRARKQRKLIYKYVKFEDIERLKELVGRKYHEKRRKKWL